MNSIKNMKQKLSTNVGKRKISATIVKKLSDTMEHIRKISGVDIVKVDSLLIQKIPKRHFLKDIEKSLQEVTPIGLETCHFFSF